jgi:uncharacterized protein
MDVFMQLRKADTNGQILQNINIPLKDLQMKAEDVVTINPTKYLGPTGILRASHRKIDEERSKPHWALHSHLEEEKVPKGEVVESSLGIWPSGIVFEWGERLVLKVYGYHVCLAEFEHVRGKFGANNKGAHQVHVGGRYGSRVVVPFVEVD